MTWSDDNCPKGFHIFDTVDKTLERIVNPYTIFEKIYYDDTTTAVSYTHQTLPTNREV